MVMGLLDDRTKIRGGKISQAPRGIKFKGSEKRVP